jgi:hypothetical protein
MITRALTLSAAAVLLAAVLCPPRCAIAGELLVPDQIDRGALFSEVGRMYRLDPDLLAAIAQVESGGSSKAVSPAGAQGMMQLMPDTARRMGVDHPFDPIESALGAARYLDELRADSPAGGRITDLIAAYNAGEGAVRRFEGIPPYSETRQYVRRVLSLYLLGRPSSTSETPGPGPESRRSPRSPGPIEKRTLAAKPAGGDRIVLDQLEELKRLRATAAAGQPH